MDIFYIIVLSVMVIVLILYLTLMGIKLSFTKGANSNIKIQSCPDSWSSIMYNDKQWCVTPTNITCDWLPTDIDKNKQSNCNKINNIIHINFKSDEWIEKAGNEGILLKDKWKKWANSKKISWDTVTNS